MAAFFGNYVSHVQALIVQSVGFAFVIDLILHTWMATPMLITSSSSNSDAAAEFIIIGNINDQNN